MWKVMISFALLLLPVMGKTQDALFGPDGYRIAHYRAPVFRAPAGVGRVAPEVVATLRPDVDALLIDVLPAEGGQRNSDGTWRLAVARPSIPGAHWFPEAGRGVLSPDIGPWFERGIARLTHGAKGPMIVTFCLADCWMSWNAARRLRALGYTNVWWFAQGTDGWRDLGLALVDATPERARTKDQLSAVPLPPKPGDTPVEGR
ncbi:PQQ-dependent catabolism-associated CXXCW motif protein [soil metagenome]